ncbi:hypothetical protein [Kribbella sp. DT2]|uniref:hypothetical protein n=1 Tax=Kribbella sp. DT2 TaxID=3393427 RepID=UPI003CF5F643
MTTVATISHSVRGRLVPLRWMAFLPADALSPESRATLLNAFRKDPNQVSRP